jgi:hypothetical protein
MYTLDEILVFRGVVKNMVQPSMCTLCAVSYGHESYVEGGTGSPVCSH